MDPSPVAIADGDPNRQLQQVKNFITRRVDGIILVPKDAKSCIPAIRAANAAKIPIVLFNRPAGETDAKSVMDSKPRLQRKKTSSKSCLVF